MPTLRIEKNRNYTVMSNHHLRDKRLKLKTIGLMSIMLSLPDNWDFSEAGLSMICKDGISTIKAALKELEIYGYLSRNYARNKRGRFEDIEYILREYPMAEKPISVNHTEINTNLIIKDSTPYCAREENRKSVSGEEQNYCSQPLTEGERNPSSSCGAPPPRDPAYAEISAEYQRLLHFQPMGIASTIVADGIKNCCKEAVLYAIEETARQGITKTPYNYINKIVEGMIAAGVKDAAGVEAYKNANETNNAAKLKKQSSEDIIAEIMKKRGMESPDV